MKTLLCAILLVTTSAFAADVVKRGAAIPPDAQPVPLANVLAKPNAFTNQTIVIEGVVEKVCWVAGCWMTVAPETGKAGIHVTFKGGAFAVPRGSSGSKVRLLGSVHAAGNNVSFVAAGVELTGRSS
ncbi:MAG TPA: DUF4920 domain-containing protein [Thermoanaerobaculia bacterium]|jgi:hypothetical protein|nr:DUF4920 domain-containing protein [Thermoanaerobaculia bacterium]